ncbi:YecA family protein [Thiolapillus sp.]|uniref:YecA/YgfB family protein n=1 Tax=Thiolapillus sp. TaxID=2017437 RepID=UPI0025ECE9DD
MEQVFSEQQMTQLEDFLLAHMEDEGCMPLDVAHGYLTAVLSGPHMIMPNTWLPNVLGDVDFASEEEAGQVMGLLMSLYNSTLMELESGEYEPMVLSMEENYDEPLPLPYGWCEGYIMGWNAHGEDTIDAMAQDEEAALNLGPVAAFMMYEEDQLLAPPNEAEHCQAADLLAESAVDLFRWWLPRRDNPVGRA